MLNEPLSFTLGEIAGWAQSILPAEANTGMLFRGGAPLESSGASDISYMDHPRYVADLRATRAGLCIVSSRFAAHVPASTIGLVVPDPYRAYATVLGHFHSDALRPGPDFQASGIASSASLHPSCDVDATVTIEPGAVVGPDARIGARTYLGCNSVIGADVIVGEDCSIGAGCTLRSAIVGDRVILHPGVRIGQDGFGFAPGATGHVKMVQLGRVVIGDDVEIGANTTIDKGSARDTVIGSGTKIDNLVQIAHNVQIGEHCIIVAQTGIAGSTILEDFVAIGGQSAIAGHLRIGTGAQLAASSKLMRDVPAGARWGGMPAKPLRVWFREQATLQKLAERKR